MNSATGDNSHPAEGRWSTFTLAGHSCHEFEPASPSPHGFTVIYLHGVHLATLAERPVFTRLLGEHGLRCLAPVTGRCWWSDRICSDFDPVRSAEQFVQIYALTLLAANPIG